MKRIVSLLIILMMILALSACSSEGADLYQKYASIIDMLEMKDYNGAIQEIAQMAMQEQMGGQEKTPVVEILANTWTTKAEKGPKQITFTTDGTLTVDGKNMTWTTDKGEMGTDMCLQIFEDGKHKYVAYFKASERYAVPYINLYYMEEVDGYMQQGDSIGTYYNHPMVTKLMGYSWHAVSEFEKIIDGFWMQNGDFSINGDSYSWKVTDGSKQDCLTIQATGKNGVDNSYTMVLTMRDEYPVLKITDDNSGASGVYCSDGFGEDDQWVENLYATAVNRLEQFVNNGYFWTNDYTYEDEEAINFLHDAFTACGDYKDSAERLNNWDSVWFIRANRYLQRYMENGYFYTGPEDTNYNDYSGAVEFLYDLMSEIKEYPEAATVLENWNDVLLTRANRILQSYLERHDGQLYINGKYLSANASRAYVYEQFKAIEGSDEAAAVLEKFSIVPQKYMGATYKTVDNMGNQGNGTWETFRYNELGQMIFADYADEMYEIYGDTSDLHFFYNEAGVMTEVKIAYNLESSITAVLSPTYDEKGNLISMTANYNDGTYTYTYAYDDAGRRTSAVINKNANGGTDKWYIYTYTYTYDEAGRLAEKVKSRNNTKYTTTYTYDDNGFLIQEVLVESSYDSWSGTTSVRDTTTMTYTNDAQGRHITAERTSDESGFNYRSYTITYNYEDLYFYNAD